MSQTNLKTIYSLQAGRALAALAVVMHHAAISTNDLVARFPSALGKTLDFGWLGVDFFFVLSGFIIYHTTQSKPQTGQGARKYAKSRIVRIYVPYVPMGIALTGAYTVFPHLGLANVGWSWLASLTLLPVGKPALMVAWTLQHEVVFYAIFALGFFTGRLRLILALWTIAILVGLVFSAEHYTPWRRVLLSPINLEFMFGIACAILVFKVRRFDSWLYGIIAVIAFATWASLGARTELSPIVGVGFAALIILLVRLELNGRMRVPDMLVFLGGASYALYLIHSPIMALIARIVAGLPMLSNVYVAFPVGVVASVVAGCLYHVWFEEPVRKWAQRRLATFAVRPPLGSGPTDVRNAI